MSWPKGVPRSDETRRKLSAALRGKPGTPRAGVKHRRPTRYELAKDDPWPFWDQVLIGDGCWEWQGTKGTFGYGVARAWKRQTTAHRRAWELWHGSIPEGVHVLHRCDNPPCVRPDHLFLGTPADNVMDMIAKGRRGRPAPPLKTHCRHGHELAGANVVERRHTDGHVFRACRACARANRARYLAKRGVV